MEKKQRKGKVWRGIAGRGEGREGGRKENWQQRRSDGEQ